MKTKKIKKNLYKRTKKNLSRKIKKKMIGGEKSEWEKLPEYLQKLSNRKSGKYKKMIKSKEDSIDSCESYNEDKVINIKYKLTNVDKESPVKIFREGENNNYDLLEFGVHNFILSWDSIKKKYILVTSLFNAFEYGQKHYMMSYRLDYPINKGIPDDFIFSGELKKDETNIIKFHDTSSLYGVDNEMNFQNAMARYYLDVLINNKTEDELKNPDIIEKLKVDFLNNITEHKGRIPPSFKSSWNKVKTIQELKEFISNTYFVFAKGSAKYYEYLVDILNDALVRIFDVKNIETKFEEFIDYGEQKNKKKFIDKLCKFYPPIEFDIYKDESDCYEKVNPIQKSCA